MIYKVKQSDQDQRLDKFLTEKLKNFSRSKIQKMIKQGQILVDNKKVLAHYQLKANEAISLITQDIEKEKKTYPKEKIPELRIVNETADYLIIDKPAGVIVHPTESHPNKTLVDAILEKYPGIKSIGEDPSRPGIIHRIDKDVSGLLVVARNQKAFDLIKKQFKEKTIKKEYIALVHKPMERGEGIIDFPIQRSITGKMKALPKTVKEEKQADGKLSITEYEVIKNYINYALLRITIKTGRTHQIRVHLNAIGHPIVGDKLYGSKKIKDKFKLDRIFLHSSLLGFIDLDGKYVEFSLKLPDELKAIRDSLNNK